MNTHRMNKRGITLTELLVASILIGIVMIGVASFSASIHQLQSSSNRSAILSMRAITAMNRLTRDAYLAVGDESNPDPDATIDTRGIVTRVINPNHSICFRHEPNNPPTGSYADDEWHCYYFELNANSREFSACTVPTPVGDVPPNNASKCGGAAKEVLLTLDYPPAGPEPDTFFQVNTDINGTLESIDFTLRAIFDPDEAPDPITNPTYTITTTINPLGISR